MKKAFPVVMIVAMALTAITSCSKKSSESRCTCTERGSMNQDTTFSFTAVDTPFTKLSDECSTFDAILKIDSTHYGCHL